MISTFDGEKIGSVSISMYKNKDTNLSFFYIESENDDMLPISYLIEDTLKLY